MKKTKFSLFFVAVFLLWLSLMYYLSYRRSLTAVSISKGMDYSTFKRDTISPRGDMFGGYFIKISGDGYYAIHIDDSLFVKCLYPESARRSWEVHKEEQYQLIKTIMDFFDKHNRRGLKIVTMQINETGRTFLSYSTFFHTTDIYINWEDSIVRYLPQQCLKYADQTYYRITGPFDYLIALH